MSPDPTLQTAAAEALLAREALILGQPPRIPPIEGVEAEKAALVLRQKVLTGMFGAAPAIGSAELPEIFLTMQNYPSLFEKVSNLPVALYRDATLAPRDRELVVLRLTWLRLAPYAWGEHVRKAKQAGISSSEIERITIGHRAPEWSEHERALLQATEELVADAMISDAVWQSLAKRLDERQLFELTVLAGAFTLVAYYQNALRLRLSPANDGLRSR
jgi:alkylhydroperoxidase family enzyme